MIGMQETIIILIIAPSKLPELARSLGKATGEFKKAQIDIENELKRNISLEDCNGKEKDRDIKIRNLAIEMSISVENLNNLLKIYVIKLIQASI